jgi:hypothetical protein
MSASEFMAWQEYDEAYTSESWYQTALICLTIVQALTGSKSARLEDFLPPRKGVGVQPMPGEALKSRFAGFREAHNKRIAGGTAQCVQPPRMQLTP